MKGPTTGATFEGRIDYPGHQLRMTGTLVPMDGLNNQLRQIPSRELFLGAATTGGFIGANYEVVGSPEKPMVRTTPMSAMNPGLLRKFREFRAGSIELASPDRPPND